MSGTPVFWQRRAISAGTLPRGVWKSIAPSAVITRSATQISSSRLRSAGSCSSKTSKRSPATEFDVPVKVELGNQPLLLEGEQVLIGQVIINLCMNAIDEIKDSDNNKELHVTLRDDGGLASLSIADQARGMKEHPPDRLALGAFSSKEDGSGIGLIISEQIAQRHGGTIQFTPNEPQGTI